MQITNKVTIEKKRWDQIQSSVKSIFDFKKETEKVLLADATRVLETVLAGAITLDASDIHFEPEEERVRIRLRVDGFLQDVLSINSSLYKTLLSRIKLLSEIKLNISAQAQDGRFTASIGQTATEIRVSTLPSEYGESVVLRVLAVKNILKLEDLGVREELMAAFAKEIARPHGLIIITGPTGSGKTTTLYAILQAVNSPSIKIITIEDPIEYHLDGVSQTQVDPSRGYNFANGLQAIMRQDPDVILVGEVRDAETAKLAIQAAITGHLVLTTLHSNDAAGTVARLRALEEKASNIAPAINLIIAQRLVRRACLQCRQLTPITTEELDIIKKNLNPLSGAIHLPNLDMKLRIPRAVGCPTCGSTGYRGRVGIFEFMFVDEEMQNFILKSPSIVDLKKKAAEKGMINMRQNGLIKVLSGDTTIEEINRETGEI